MPTSMVNVPKLFGPIESVQVRKCLAVANAAKVDFANSHSKTGDDTKAAFLAISPLSTYPVLQTSQGSIYGSNAICRFFVSAAPLTRLGGRDIYESAQCEGHIESCANILEVALYRKVQLECPEAEADIQKYLTFLDRLLTAKTYVVGDRLSYADIVIAIVVKHCEESGSAISVAIARYLDTIFADKRVSKAMLTKSPLPGASPRRGKKFGSKESDATKSPSSPSPETESVAAPVVVPSNPVPETEPVDATPFDMGHPALVAIDPDTYNKSPAEPIGLGEDSLHMESWKREYSNSKTPEEFDSAFESFFAKYKAEEYTVWKMVYDKYEGEGEKDFLTSNLLNGFIQRIDPACRKNGVGIFHVLGGPGDYNYEGVIVLRGTEMPFYMQDHVSFEYHRFARMDMTDESQRQLVKDFFINTDAINGKAITDTKQVK